LEVWNPRVRSETENINCEYLVRTSRLGRASLTEPSFRYTSPLGIQEKLIATFKPSTSRTAPPSLYKTPPYVTADPVVSAFNLSSSQAEATGSIPAPSELSNATPVAPASATAQGSSQDVDFGRRFIVLATDGLYDCLSSEEVVALVAGHLDGLKGDKTKNEVLGRLQSGSDQTSLVSPHKPREDKDKGRRFTFEDSNLSTHLVR
jgi:pyruvate dehydrogenase phosphatase